jgi:pSer/pThr/pTyr-binding forkhead associated (FHA) protein
VEWPWGATTLVTDKLNIGREFGFCPVAHELQPYRHLSRRHAELLVSDAGIWVRDLHSHNHTFVNDEEIPPGQAYLVDTDSRIRCGPNFVVLLKLER